MGNLERVFAKWYGKTPDLLNSDSYYDGRIVSPCGKYTFLLRKTTQSGRWPYLDVCFKTSGLISCTQIFRVSACRQGSLREHGFNVSVSTIDDKLKIGGIKLVTYYWKNDGCKGESCSTSIPVRQGIYRKMTDSQFNLAFIHEQCELGIYRADEIPTKIDIMKTAAIFFDQIKNGDFSIPKLISKYQ